MATNKLFAATLITVGCASALAFAAPGSTADKPLVDIVQQLEERNYGPFTDVSLDDGAWEVEVYKDGLPYELVIDPGSGEILREHRDDADPKPPKSAQALSKILHQLTEKGFDDVHDISFERRYWEVEVMRADGEHELHVDPRSGEILRDQIDD